MAEVNDERRAPSTDGTGTVGATGPPHFAARSALAVVALALLAAGVVLWASRDGAATSADSSVYVATARSVAQGHGLDVPFHYYPLGSVSIGTPPPGRSTPVPTPLVIYAPLEPLLLAVGNHPFGAARIEDALFFALTVLIVGLFVLRVTEVLWLALAAQAVVTFGLALEAAGVGTIAAALFFATAAIAAVLAHRRRPHPALLLVAVVAIALATLERYASGGLIVWGVLAMRQRRRDALLLATSGLPLVAWFVYEAVSGRSTGHQIGFHIVRSTLKAGVRSAADWFFPSSSPLLLAVVAVLVVAAAALALSRHYPTARLALLLLVVQVVVLEVAITFFDAGVNLDPDEFVPLFLALAVALACCVRRTPVTAVVVAAVVVGAVIRFGVDTTTDPTFGYTSPTWVHSPIMADVRALPHSAVIYSNAPDALYLLAHRATSSVPEQVDFSTLKTNRLFDAQLEQIRTTITGRGAYVVFVRGLGRSSFLPTESTLVHDLSLRVVRNARDGAIYTIGAPT